MCGIGNICCFDIEPVHEINIAMSLYLTDKPANIMITINGYQQLERILNIYQSDFFFSRFKLINDNITVLSNITNGINRGIDIFFLKEIKEAAAPAYKRK